MDLKPKSLLRRVFDFAREELERRSRPPAAPEEPSSAAPAPLEEPLAPTPRSAPPKAARATALEVTRTDAGRLSIRWSVEQADLSRTRALVHDDAVLCLRVVSFEGTRDDVKREVLDRPFVEPSGDCELSFAEARGVVAVGLRAGERFVSIAHYVL